MISTSVRLLTPRRLLVATDDHRAAAITCLMTFTYGQLTMDCVPTVRSTASIRTLGFCTVRALVDQQ